MTAIEVLKAQITAGLMELRPDGTIWKLANRDNQQRVIPITPKRAERKSKRGYLMVKMEWLGQPYLLSAHVAAYVLLKGPLPEGFDVNHKDGVKANNQPTNLEPLTRSDNHKHAYRTSLREPAPHIPPPVLARVSEQAKDLRSQGLPYAEIAARLKVSQTTAYRATQLK
jgi:hypothetical protein